MTISNPPLPSDPLVPGAPAPSADPAPAAPAGGFDQLMAAGVPAMTEACVMAPVGMPEGDAPAGEQAAVLAASILWAPLPLLAAPPPPPETLAGAPAPTENPIEGNEGILSPVAPDTLMTAPAPDAARSFQATTAVSTAFQAPEASRTLETPVAAPGAGSEACNIMDYKPPGPVAANSQPVSDAKGAQAAPAGAPVEGEVATAPAVEAEVTPPVSIPADRPVARRAVRIPGRGEIIADMPLTPAVRPPIERAEAVKTFVSHYPQEARVEEGFVGTGVAKPGFEMPFAPAEHPVVTAAHASVHVAPEGEALQFDLSAHAEPVHRARDTVATVLSVIDAQDKPEAANRTVNMDFDFGGEKLAVRVEFRDGTVRAHFRTQSLELRSALATEWSHASAAPENILRAVEPVFVTSSRSEQSASFHADSGAHRQQQQPAPPSSPLAALAGHRGARPVETVTPAADESLRLRRPYTTRHLHAIA